MITNHSNFFLQSVEHINIEPNLKRKGKNIYIYFFFSVSRRIFSVNFQHVRIFSVFLSIQIFIEHFYICYWLSHCFKSAQDFSMMHIIKILPTLKAISASCDPILINLGLFWSSQYPASDYFGIFFIFVKRFYYMKNWFWSITNFLHINLQISHIF